MIKSGDKKGSHVGVMISFVIFVTFLIFLYAILSPAIYLQKDKKSVLESLELGITEKISSELTMVTIDLTGSVSQNCIQLDDGTNVLGIGNNLAAKEELGTNTPVYVSSTDSQDIKINRISTSDNFLKIYYSEAFDDSETSSLSCTNLVKGSGYNVGLVKTQEYIFEKNMLDLIGEYGNYETLRNDLKIPEGTEFGYGIILSNGTAFETNGKEPSTNIYIRKKPLEYVSTEGDIVMGYLVTKIW